jgi:hypothetical protein
MFTIYDCYNEEMIGQHTRILVAKTREAAIVYIESLAAGWDKYRAKDIQGYIEEAYKGGGDRPRLGERLIHIEEYQIIPVEEI